MKERTKKKNITLDGLATMVAGGFSDLETKSGKKFKNLEEGQDQTNKRLKNLKDGQEQIKLRLDNVAYRFELVELQRRVVLFERKAGVRH